MNFSRRNRMVILVIYFIIINVLFTLPGSAFPTDDWMSRIWFDKWVHIGIFFVLVIIAAWTFPLLKNRWMVIFISAVAYGLFVEYAQDNWIPNRGFDIGDWVADCVGTIAGILAFRRVEKK